MSDSSNFQSGGPHPTVAGNLFDPNVAADGHKNSGGGVGGADEANIRQEGLEHIKNNTTNPTSGSTLGSSGDGYGSGSLGGGTGNTSSGLGDSYSSNQPSTSSYGQDTSSGLSQTNSGTQSGGILGSVKNFIGLGGNSSATDSSTTGTSSNLPSESYGETAPSSLGGTSTGGLGGPGDREYINSSTSGSDSRIGETAGAGALGGAALGSSSNYGRDNESSLGGSTLGRDNDPSYSSSSISGRDADPTLSGSNDALKRPDENPSIPRDNDVTTGNKPSLDPSGTESATNEGSTATAADLKSHEHDGKRENRDAIPTAGGQKLGAKHWGESKIVPEVPKLTEAGVASEAGQPDSTTRDNTNKNLGSAPTPGAGGAGGASPGGEKQSIADKLKSGLHLGGHKDT